MLDQVTYREMVEQDLDRVMRIERACHIAPWTGKIFRDCLDVGYQCVVMEHSHAVIAYGVLSIAVNEAHIFNLCVDPANQRQGYGRNMLNYLIEMSRLGNANSIYLEVRPSNEGAIALYKDLGFSEVGVRKRYYPSEGGREDALILARDL